MTTENVPLELIALEVASRHSVFPFEMKTDRGTFEYRGISKRELFAAVAMQGFCALPGTGDVCAPQTIASMAVVHADALLAELAKVKS